MPASYDDTNWDTAYTHSQVTTGNPHSIGYADISDFNTGVSTYETSHADVIVDGDFSSNGILRRTGAGTYTSLTGSGTVDTVETSVTNDDTHLPTSGAVVDYCSGFITGNQTITLSGDVSGSGTTSITTTIGSTAVEHSMLNNNVITGASAATALQSTDSFLIYDIGATDLREATVTQLQTYMQSNLSFTGAYWDRSAPNVTLANAGDDILLASATELIKWGDGDTYLYENADDVIHLFTAGSIIMAWNSNSAVYCYEPFIPGATNTHTLGNSSYVWNDVYSENVTFNERWRIFDLPAFSMGASGITDEYLVLCPLWDDGSSAPPTINPVGLNGRIIFQRGGTAAGSNMSEITLVLQSAYNVDTCYAFEVRGDAIFTSIDEITIDSVPYWALKARTAGGGAAYGLKFVGDVYNVRSDTNFLTRVRVSDADVAVTTTGVHYPHYTNDEGIITLGVDTVLEVDGSRIVVGGETNTLSPTPDYFVQAGSHTLGKYGAFTVKGYQTADTEQVGSYYFQNFASAATGSIICEMSTYRQADNDAGHFFLYVADSGGTRDTAYDVHSTQHAWSINGINEMYLNASTLNPASSTGLGLGTSSLPWGTSYLNRLYLPGISYTDRSDALQYLASTDEVSYYAEASDIRFKDVIGPIEGASASLRKIDPFMFTINELGYEKVGWDMEKIRYGVSAQQTLPVFEHLVGPVNAKEAEEYLKVDYQSFIPIIHAAHNEHSVSLEDHERVIGFLRGELEQLRKEIEILTNKFK
jgi:hypothetical protein